MKKLYLAVLALMIGAIGFAQSNSSTVTQNGTDLMSTVNQDGNSNRAVQNQTGNDMEAKIKQVGTNNYANQLQSSSTGNGNFANIDQNGRDNDARQEQTGNNSNNSNNAYANQKGIGNISRQTQITQRTIGDVRQNGTANRAYQTQKQDAKAYIVQSRNRNVATQNQLTGKFNYAKTTQSGDDNRSSQTQNGQTRPAFISQWSQLYVVQAGNNNTATQDQDTEVRQEFIPNIASITQEVTSRDGIADQKQYGNYDYAKIVQKGGRDNRGYQNQDSQSVNAEARLLQNGNFNRSWQTQTGMDMTSIVNQTGNSHVSRTTQSGSTNTTNVTQSN